MSSWTSFNTKKTMAKYRHYTLVKDGESERLLLSEGELLEKFEQGYDWPPNDDKYSDEVGCPALHSGRGLGRMRTDSGFNDVMSRIADANPHSIMAQTHGNKGIQASKVREAVNKERVRQYGQA